MSFATERMVSGDSLQERRRRKRFPAKEGCLITLGNDPIRLWQVLDVSEGGLAFRYIGGKEDTSKISKLDILTQDTVFCIERIPFEVVSDSEIPGAAPRRYLLNRCSGRFGELTQEQRGLLSALINRYTNIIPSAINELPSCSPPFPA